MSVAARVFAEVTSSSPPPNVRTSTPPAVDTTLSLPSPVTMVSAPVLPVMLSAPDPVVIATPPAPTVAVSPAVKEPALTVVISSSKAALMVKAVLPVISNVVAPTPVVCRSARELATEPVSIETVSIVLVAPAADVRATVVAVAPSKSINKSSDALAIAAFEKFTVTVSFAEVFSPKSTSACKLLNVTSSSDATTFRFVSPLTDVMSKVLAAVSTVTLNV